jgi:hypothetical protein
MKLIFLLAWVIAAVLAAAGAAFIFAPDWSFANLDHTRDGLPYVFGGRYVGLGVAIALFAWFRDLRGLGIMSLAGGTMAIVDVVTYASLNEPVALIAPHGLVAIICVLVAATVFRNQNKVIV